MSGADDLPAEAPQGDGRCRACGHGPERHDPEVPGCIECRCSAYLWADGDETADRLEYLSNLARVTLAARPSADTKTLQRVLALADELDAEARGYAEEAERLPSDHPNRYALLGRILGKKASANRIRAALDEL